MSKFVLYVFDNISYQNYKYTKRCLMIQIENILKTSDELKILDNISLKINDGEIFGYLGPNGSGKTSTINILSGIDTDYTGSYKIDDIEFIQEKNNFKKKIGHVPEHPHLFPYLTGSEFLWFIGSLYLIDEEILKKNIEYWGDFFKVTPWFNRLSKNFPKGIRQKFGLIAALINDPEILLLDEPTSSLDPSSAHLVKLLINELKNQGKTIFLTTHILEIAEILCDRVAIIKDGAIIAEGTVDYLKQNTSKENANLEDIFLELTGEFEYKELIENLRK